MRILYKTKANVNGNIYRLCVDDEMKAFSTRRSYAHVEIKVTKKELKELEKELIKNNYFDLDA